jgi:hypothetical protein
MEEIGGYKVHPAASVFPLIEGEEFDELVESIKTNGLQHPIIVDGDVLIDGRNRLRAIMRLVEQGDYVEPRIEKWKHDGRSITEWIYDTNFVRRHMTEDARVFVSSAICKIIAQENAERKKAALFNSAKASEAAKARHALDTDSCPTQTTPERDVKEKHERSTVGQVAKKAGTSMHKARQAIAVQKAIEAGQMSVEVGKEIVAGKKKLKDVLPKKQKQKKQKAKPCEDDCDRTQEQMIDDVRLLITDYCYCKYDRLVLIKELEYHISKLKESN